MPKMVKVVTSLLAIK